MPLLGGSIKTPTPIRNVVPRLFVVPLILVMVACGGSYGHNSGPPSPSETLYAIYLIASASPGIPVGSTVQVGANGEYHSSPTSFSYQDVTQTVTWSTSNSAVATVTNGGLVTGIGIGRSIITASLQGRTGTTLVVVGQTPSLVFEAKDAISLDSISEFRLIRPYVYFDLIATYPDGSELNLANYAAWGSSSPEVLAFVGTADAGPSEATLVATGTTTVTATLSTGEVKSMEVTVVP